MHSTQEIFTKIIDVRLLVGVEDTSSTFGRRGVSTSTTILGVRKLASVLQLAAFSSLSQNIFNYF